MTRLAFHEDRQVAADIHPVFTATMGHDPRPGYDPYSTEGTWGDEGVGLGFVVSTPYRPVAVNVTIPLKRPPSKPSVYVSVVVITLPIQPDLIYLARSNPNQYFYRSWKRFDAVPLPAGHLYQYRGWLNQVEKRVVVNASFFGLVPSDCLWVSIELRTGWWRNMDYSFGTVDIEEVASLRTGLEFPQYSELKDQLAYSLVVTNVGTGPGRFALEGQEVFLETGQGAQLAKQTPFVVKDTKDYEGSAASLFVASNPAPGKDVPDLMVANSEVASGSTSPVRFLWIDGDTVMLKGDAPSTDSISYKGILLAREVTGEPLPMVLLSGSLAPLREVAYKVKDLKLLRLEFSREVTVAEYGRIRGESTNYEYQAPLPGPLFWSRVKLLPLMGSRQTGIIAARVPAIRRL